jgi:hypothetical protein
MGVKGVMIGMIGMTTRAEGCTRYHFFRRECVYGS